MKRLLSAILICCVHTLHGQDGKLHIVQDYCREYCSGAPEFMGILNGKAVFNIFDEKYHNFYTFTEDALYQVNTFEGLENISNGTEIDGNIYFTSYYDAPTESKSYLCVWDGASTIKYIISDTGLSNKPVIITKWKNRLYFRHRNATFEYNPASKQIHQVAIDTVISTVIYNDKFYYVLYEAPNHRLMVCDPANKTNKTVAIYYGTKGRAPANFIVAGEKLYYTAFDTVYGRELYSIEGDHIPTRITNVYPGADIGYGSYSTTHAFHLNNQIYFTATRDSSIYTFAQEYFVYNISNNTTVKDNTLNRYKATIITDFKENIIFSSTNNNSISGLYSYNPAKQTVKQILPADTFTFKTFSALTSLNNTLFLTGGTKEVGAELFRYYEEPPYTLDATIYPNPATAEAYVKLGTDTTQAFVLTMYDAMGREIMWRNLGTFKKGEHTITLPLQQLAAGIYICTLRGSNRGIVLRQKLVKL